MEGFDLSTLDVKSAAESGAILELEDPRNGEPLTDKEGKPYFVEIVGMDSAKLKAAARKLADRRITNIRRGKQVDYDSEAEDQERYGLYALATKSWYLPPVDGQTLECTEPNARKLYSDERFPWLVEQIDRAIVDRKRFFSKASQT